MHKTENFSPYELLFLCGGDIIRTSLLHIWKNQEDNLSVILIKFGIIRTYQKGFQMSK